MNQRVFSMEADFASDSTTSRPGSKDAFGLRGCSGICKESDLAAGSKGPSGREARRLPMRTIRLLYCSAVLNCPNTEIDANT
jgi:hypothetical protein